MFRTLLIKLKSNTTHKTFFFFFKNLVCKHTHTQRQTTLLCICSFQAVISYNKSTRGFRCFSTAIHFVPSQGPIVRKTHEAHRTHKRFTVKMLAVDVTLTINSVLVLLATQFARKGWFEHQLLIDTQVRELNVSESNTTRKTSHKDCTERHESISVHATQNRFT